jgi:hypothetical protein
MGHDALARAASQGWLSRVTMAAVSLWREGIGKPRARPLAKLRARHAALGFPFRRDPHSREEEPDRRCDCVPWQGF